MPSEEPEHRTSAQLIGSWKTRFALLFFFWPTLFTTRLWKIKFPTKRPKPGDEIKSGIVAQKRSKKEPLRPNISYMYSQLLCIILRGTPFLQDISSGTHEVRVS